MKDKILDELLEKLTDRLQLLFLLQENIRVKAWEVIRLFEWDNDNTNSKGLMDALLAYDKEFGTLLDISGDNYRANFEQFRKKVHKRWVNDER